MTSDNVRVISCHFPEERQSNTAAMAPLALLSPAATHVPGRQRVVDRVLIINHDAGETAGYFGRVIHRRRSVSSSSQPGHDEILTMLRSEEHTSELQSRFDLVCRLLLDIKN